MQVKNKARNNKVKNNLFYAFILVILIIAYYIASNQGVTSFIGKAFDVAKQGIKELSTANTKANGWEIAKSKKTGEEYNVSYETSKGMKINTTNNKPSIFEIPLQEKPEQIIKSFKKKNETNISMLSSVQPNLTQGQIWQSIGPGIADWIWDLTINNNSDLYAGFDIAGIYKTSDYGNIWQSLNLNHGLKNYYITSIAINPENNNIIYASTYGGIFKSLDAGKTWTAKRQGIGGPAQWSFTAIISSIAIDPNNSSILYAGVGDDRNERYGQGKIFKSIDAGESWQNKTVGSNNNIISWIVVDPFNSERVYATTHEGFFKSNDHGETWQQHNNGLESNVLRFIAADPKNECVLYVTAKTTNENYFNGGVYKSVDCGESWQKINNGLSQETGWIGDSYQNGADQYRWIAINPENSNIIFVGNNNYGKWHNGVFKTTNAGQSWNKSTIWVNEYQGQESNVDYGWNGQSYSKNQAATAIAIDPNNPNIVYWASTCCVYKSEDNGDSWHQTYTNSVDENNEYWTSRGMNVFGGVLDIAFDEQNNIVYGGFNDQGLMKSLDNGYSWKDLRPALPRIGGGIPGKAWDIIVDPDQSNIVYAVISSGFKNATVVKSFDYGESWQVISNGLPQGVNGFKAIQLVMDETSNANSRILYAAVTGHGIYKTINGGESWFKINTTGIPEDERLYTELVINPKHNNRLYLALKFYGNNAGGVYYSSDSGVTWSKISNEDMYSVEALHIDKHSTLYAGTSHKNNHYPGVFRYNPITSSWDRLLTPKYKEVDRTRAITTYQNNNEYIIFAGFDDDPYHDEPLGSGVYISLDYGNTWREINYNIPVTTITSITVRNSTKQVFVGSPILYKASLDDIKGISNIHEGLNVLSTDLAKGSGNGWYYDNGLVLSNSSYQTPILSANFTNESQDTYPLWSELFINHKPYQNLVLNPGFEQGQTGYGVDIPNWTVHSPNGYTYEIIEGNDGRYLRINVSSVSGARTLINQTVHLNPGYYVLIFSSHCDEEFSTTGNLLANIIIPINNHDYYLRTDARSCSDHYSSINSWLDSRPLILKIPQGQEYDVKILIRIKNLLDNVNASGIAKIDDVKLLEINPVIKLYGVGSNSLSFDFSSYNKSNSSIIAMIAPEEFIAFKDDDLQYINNTEGYPLYAQLWFYDFLEAPIPQGFKYGIIVFNTTTSDDSTIKIQNITIAVYKGLHFLVPWNVTVTTATDLSQILYGGERTGAIITEGNDLRFNSSQQTARFWGAAYEITPSYCWNNETVMRSIAKRLKTHGFNLVKLVGLTTTVINDSVWDCYDKFIKILEDEGFYIYISIGPVQIFQYILGPFHRIHDNDENFTGLKQNITDLFGSFPEFDYFYQGSSWPYNGPVFKNVMYTNNPEIISFLQNLIRYELNHTNPYTGIKYKDDPRIAFLELSNENYLIRKWQGGNFRLNNNPIPTYYQDLFDEEWHNFLIEKYNNDFNLLNQSWDDGTGIGLEDDETSFDTIKREPDFDGESPWGNPYSNKRTSDLALFYEQQQEKLFNNLSSFVKKNLNAKQLIIGTQSETPWDARLVQYSKSLDVVDTHRYYDHPIGYYKELHDLIKNRNPFDTDFLDFYTLFGARYLYNIKGKPQTISEYNWPLTNSYYFMLIPMFMAYSSLQGFSAPIMHSYQHCCIAQGQEYPPTSDHIGETIFRFTNNPVSLLQHLIAGLAFVRGDFNKGQAITINMSKEFVDHNGKLLTKSGQVVFLNNSFIENHYSMVHRLIFDYNATTTNNKTLYEFTNAFKSDTSELVFNYSSKLFKAISNKTIAIAGKIYDNNNNIQAGPLQLQVENPLYGSVMLTSLDDQPIESSNHLLLIGVSRAKNYGMQCDASGRYYEQWGLAPVIANPVEGLAILMLDNVSNVTLYALNPAGERLGIVPSQVLNNEIRSNLGQSLWYEVVISHVIHGGGPGTPNEGGGSGGGMPSSSIICYSNIDCDDNNSLTIDECLNPGTTNSVCVHETTTNTCLTNNDCDDNNACTLDVCINNECSHTKITPCCGNGVCEPGEDCDIDCKQTASKTGVSLRITTPDSIEAGTRTTINISYNLNNPNNNTVLRVYSSNQIVLEKNVSKNGDNKLILRSPINGDYWIVTAEILENNQIVAKKQEFIKLVPSDLILTVNIEQGFRNNKNITVIAVKTENRKPGRVELGVYRNKDLFYLDYYRLKANALKKIELEVSHSGNYKIVARLVDKNRLLDEDIEAFKVKGPNVIPGFIVFSIGALVLLIASFFVLKNEFKKE